MILLVSLKLSACDEHLKNIDLDSYKETDHIPTILNLLLLTMSYDDDV